MMAIFRKLVAAGATMLAGYAMKKMMTTIESHAEKIKAQAENARDPGEFKRLKQDPSTGVYYAED